MDDKYIEVKYSSKIAGEGAFAAIDILPGTFISHMGGYMMSPAEMELYLRRQGRMMDTLKEMKMSSEELIGLRDQYTTFRYLDARWVLLLDHLLLLITSIIQLFQQRPGSGMQAEHGLAQRPREDSQISKWSKGQPFLHPKCHGFQI